MPPPNIGRGFSPAINSFIIEAGRIVGVEYHRTLLICEINNILYPRAYGYMLRDVDKIAALVGLKESSAKLHLEI